MNAEQEYKQLKRKKQEIKERLITNQTLQELKRKDLFKKLKVDCMEDAEVALKKLGKAAKKAELSVQGILKRMKEYSDEIQKARN